MENTLKSLSKESDDITGMHFEMRIKAYELKFYGYHIWYSKLSRDSRIDKFDMTYVYVRKFDLTTVIMLADFMVGDKIGLEMVINRFDSAFDRQIKEGLHR